MKQVIRFPKILKIVIMMNLHPTAQGQIPAQTLISPGHSPKTNLQHGTRAGCTTDHMTCDVQKERDWTSGLPSELLDSFSGKKNKKL